MNDNFIRRLIMFTITLLLIAICIFSANAAFADVEEPAITISVNSIREIVTYTNALEAENKQYKQSLETERASIDKMLTDIETERKQTAEYNKLLENRNKETNAKITKLEKINTRRNHLIAILTAAIVTLAVTR